MWGQQTGAAEQTAPSPRDSLTPCSKVLGAQLMRARDAKIDVLTGHR